MYEVVISNGSALPLGTSRGDTIRPGATWSSGVIGNAYVHTPYFGPLSFLDIGDAHLDGDSGETWGCLITYQGANMVGRYEGGGRLHVAIDAYLQAVLSGMTLRAVALSPLLEGETAAS